MDPADQVLRPKPELPQEAGRHLHVPGRPVVARRGQGHLLLREAKTLHRPREVKGQGLEGLGGGAQVGHPPGVARVGHKPLRAPEGQGNAVPVFHQGAAVNEDLGAHAPSLRRASCKSERQSRPMRGQGSPSSRASAFLRLRRPGRPKRLWWRAAAKRITPWRRRRSSPWP